MISIAAKESNSEENKLTDSEVEAHVLSVDPMVVATRFRQEFSKEYDQVVTDPPEVVLTPAEAATRPF